MINEKDSYITLRLNQLANGEGDYTDLQKPSAITVTRAREIINVIRNKTPNVVPTEEGTIDFNWLCDGWDISLEVWVDGAEIHAYRTSINQQ